MVEAEGHASAGRVKVLDFGVARLVEEDLTAISEALPSADERPEGEVTATLPSTVARQRAGSDVRTEAGQVLGTLRYMSPEQVRGATVTEASDMYSFGVLLQELFMGRPAYPGERPIELLGQVARAATVPISVDPDLSALIQELERHPPMERPGAEEVLSRLRSIRRKPARVRRRRLQLAAAAGLVLLLAATALVSRRASEAPLLGPGQQARVMILPFVNETGNPQLDWVERGLRGMVAETVGATSGIDVVSYEDLAKVSDPAREISDYDDDEILRLNTALGAQLGILTRVRGGESGFVLEYSSYNVNGSTGRRQVDSPELTDAANRLSARLIHRLAPAAELVEMSDRFSADPFVNRLYAMGLQRLATSGPKGVRRYFEVCLDVEPDFAWASLQLVRVHNELSEWSEAEALAVEIEERAKQQGEPWLEAKSLELQTFISLGRGDYAAARGQAEQALELFRRLEDARGRPSCCCAWPAPRPTRVEPRRLSPTPRPTPLTTSPTFWPRPVGPTKGENFSRSRGSTMVTNGTWSSSPPSWPTPAGNSSWRPRRPREPNSWPATPGGRTTRRN